ncbi:hypothetical protein BGX34_006031 [Mortierella sp. NVP85]|nr:hypothetical protein BGX34_006031 [Mortierella sp. NVP85]
MTHLSDYSFVQRSVANGWFYIWFLGYVFKYDRFAALHYKRMIRFELRSIVTFLLLIAIPLHLAYDVGCAAIKYDEGFWANPKSNEIMGNPWFRWSQPNQDKASALDYALACGMALLTSIFFLLQSFYHYISKTVTKSSFMSSFEFRLNIVCSCAVLVMFPLIQYLFRNDISFREAAPQMAFSAVLLVIALLGVRTHFRFKTLLKAALRSMSEASQGVAEKLEYFKDMNIVLTAAMGASGLSLGIASADGLRANPVIAHNKFASDFLVANVNFFEFIIWVTVVMIFYPRRSVVGAAFGQSSGSASRTAPTSTRVQNVEYPKTPSLVRKDRPPSVVIPYRAPEEGSKSDYVDIQMSPRTNDSNNNSSTFGYNDHDTYPLTHKSAYDDPLHSGTTPTPLALPRQRALSNNRFQSPPQTPVTPSSLSSPRHGAISPSYDRQQRVATPTSPVFGSGVLRQQSTASSSTTRVGQHTFVLEDTPRSPSQRNMAATDDYNGNVTSLTAPPRARKEYRSPPQY